MGSLELKFSNSMSMCLNKVVKNAFVGFFIKNVFGRFFDQKWNFGSLSLEKLSLKIPWLMLKIILPFLALFKFNMATICLLQYLLLFFAEKYSFKREGYFLCV